MGRTCVSLSIIFGVVPDDTRAWKPEIAPHMMQMKTNGNRPPQGNVGPPLMNTGSIVGACITGLATKTPTMSRAMVPILRKLER